MPEPMDPRYSRHLPLEHWGKEGQEKLAHSKILVIGAGGLSSPALLYLAGAGIGHLTLVDPDRVEVSNLSRQVLYTTADAGKFKVDAAKERLEALNPDCRVETLARALDETLAKELFPRFDLILDGSDRMDCKSTINSIAHALGKPWIYASVSGWEGRIVSLNSKREDSACLRCLHPNLKDGQIGNCELEGVVGPVVGTFGSLQALEALRMLLGISGSGSRLLSLDGKTLTTLEHRLRKNPTCTVCEPKIQAVDSEEGVLSLSVGDYQKARDQYVLVDLRPETERENHPLPAGYPSTVWGAPGTLEPIPEFHEGKTPLLLCRRGMMAYRVQAELARSGVTAVVLRGGMEAWIREGLK